MANPTYEELAELVVVQAELIKSLTVEVKLLRAEVAELKRRLDADSSNSSPANCMNFRTECWRNGCCLANPKSWSFRSSS